MGTSHETKCNFGEMEMLLATEYCVLDDLNLDNLDIFLLTTSKLFQWFKGLKSSKEMSDDYTITRLVEWLTDFYYLFKEFCDLHVKEELLGPAFKQRTRKALFNSVLRLFYCMFLKRIQENSSYFLEFVEILLAHGANINARNSSGKNPLMFFLTQSFPTEVITDLLNNRANVKEPDNLNLPALHLCSKCPRNVASGTFDTVNKILDCGRDIETRDSNGKTPLLLCLEKECNIEMITFLLLHGADPNSIDRYGMSALHYVAICCKKGLDYVLKVVSLLLQHGADVNKCTDVGTPLALFIEKFDSIDIIKLLLDSGADPNMKIYRNFTALHFVVDSFFKRDLVEVLLLYGADVNELDSKQRTVLMKCTIDSNCPVDLLQHLIDQGADPNRRDEELQTALHHCSRIKSDTLLDRVKVLLKNEVDINATDIQNSTPLFHFVNVSGDVEVIEYLLENGANPNIKTITNLSALHLICQAPKLTWFLWSLWESVIRITNLLLMYGADPFSVYHARKTPFNMMIEPKTYTLRPYYTIIITGMRSGGFTKQRKLFLRHVVFITDYNFNKKLDTDLTSRTITSYIMRESNKDLRSFVITLLQEIDMMKKCMMNVNIIDMMKKCMMNENIAERTDCIINISLYEFCKVYDKRKLGLYIKGSEFSFGLGVLRKLKIFFPLYYEMISFKVSLGERWANIFRKIDKISISVVTEGNKEISLGTDCIRELSSYLNEQSLKNLLAASLF